MQQLPSPIPAPAPKVVVDRALRWQVMGEHTPGAATAQQIEDGIEDLPLGIFLRPSSRFRLGHEMLDQVPFFISQVGRIRLSGFHAPEDTQSRLAHASFLDTL